MGSAAAPSFASKSIEAALPQTAHHGSSGQDPHCWMISHGHFSFLLALQLPAELLQGCANRTIATALAEATQKDSFSNWAPGFIWAHASQGHSEWGWRRVSH
eukprot:2090664-Rhodomonas_salina.2